MRLYSFIFMPALLFSLYRYDYLPLHLSPNTKVPKLLVFEELYGKRTYVVSQYDKEGRVYVKRFFDKEGVYLGYIKYSYLNSKISAKQYFSYKRPGAGGGFARQIKYNYDELGSLRSAEISSYGDNYYVEYEEFDEGKTYEESWYLTREKRFRIQMRKMYYREGILQREEIYTKPGADENIKLIYSKQLNYDVTGKLLNIIYYNANGAQIKQLKYIYTQRGLLDRIVVGINMLDFIHKDLGMQGTTRRYTTVLFVHDLNSIKYPKSVAQALNPRRVIARKPKKEPKKELKREEPKPKKEEVKKPEPPKAEPKKEEVKKPEPKKAEPKKVESKKVEIKKPESKKELAGWFLATKRTITTDIAQGSDSDIVVGFAPGVIAKISLKEKRYIWEYKVDSRIIISPVIEDGGRERIVFGTESGTLYCMSKDGKLLWKRDIGSFLKDSHLLLHHNIVYAQHSNYKLTAHTVETGQVLWYFDPKERNPRYISSIFRSEENIYFAIDNIIYVFDPNSGYIWSYVTAEYIVTQPVVHEERIYVSFADDMVAYSISREDLKELWSVKDIKVQGTVYVSVGEDGKASLYGVTDRGFIVNIVLGSTQMSWRSRLNKTNVLLSGNEKYLFINLLSDYIIVIDLKDGNILGSYSAVSDLERININSPKYIISNVSEEGKLLQSSYKEVIVTSLNISINDSSALIYGTSLGNIFYVSYIKDKN